MLTELTRKLERYVEQEVDERLKMYEEADEKSKGLVSVSGALAFGTADQRRDQQVAAGVKYFTKVREHQRLIKQAIEELDQALRKKIRRKKASRKLHSIVLQQ